MHSVCTEEAEPRRKLREHELQFRKQREAELAEEWDVLKRRSPGQLEGERLAEAEAIVSKLRSALQRTLLLRVAGISPQEIA